MAAEPGGGWGKRRSMACNALHLASPRPGTFEITSSGDLSTCKHVGRKDPSPGLSFGAVLWHPGWRCRCVGSSFPPPSAVAKCDQNAEPSQDAPRDDKTWKDGPGRGEWSFGDAVTTEAHSRHAFGHSDGFPNKRRRPRRPSSGFAAQEVTISRDNAEGSSAENRRSWQPNGC